MRLLSSCLALTVSCVILAALTAPSSAPASPAPQTATTAAPATTFAVDSVHSTALFRVHHLKAGQFYGRFNDIKGTFSFNERDASEMAFDITIDVESVDTNNQSLDNHLKSPDFFNAKEFPTMGFKSTSVKQQDKTHYLVSGDLTIRGITKPITSTMEFTGAADLGRGMRCGFETIFTVNRSDFEVSYGVDAGAIGNETRIIVSLEGMKR